MTEFTEAMSKFSRGTRKTGNKQEEVEIVFPSDKKRKTKIQLWRMQYLLFALLSVKTIKIVFIEVQVGLQCLHYYDSTACMWLCVTHIYFIVFHADLHFLLFHLF